MDSAISEFCRKQELSASEDHRRKKNKPEGRRTRAVGREGVNAELPSEKRPGRPARPGDAEKKLGKKKNEKDRVSTRPKGGKSRRKEWDTIQWSW